jgi:uncharacterized LabA/DUF88 family protein
MLIDCENSSANAIDGILSELAKYGVVNVRRAYGNWKSPNLKGWEEKLHEFAIKPIQQFSYTTGKNATDSAIIIDAMDLLYSKDLDAFCIVSSDSDFTPLAMRILANGLKVYGFGEKKTPSPFVNACSRFIYTENLESAENHKAKSFGPRKYRNELRSDTKLVNLLRNAVEAVMEEDEWAYLGAVGSYISNQSSFSPLNYGYQRLSELIIASGLFHIDRRNNNTEMYIKDARKPRGVAEPEVI